MNLLKLSTTRFTLAVLTGPIILSVVVLLWGNGSDVRSQEATVVPAYNADMNESTSTVTFVQSVPSERGWTTPEPETIVCRVVDFNATSVMYRLPEETNLRSRPSREVGKISFRWQSPEAAEANRAYENGQHLEAIRLGKSAISSGTLPSWQQRLLVAQMVESFSQSNQRVVAGKLFLSLLKDASPPLVYASAPLLWQSVKIDTAMNAAALEWMSDLDSIDAQLLGASWLMGTAKSEAAVETLQRIASQPNELLARLATAQLWRSATPKDVSAKYLTWRSIRDQIPVAFQTGPTSTIAEKLSRASLQTEALQEYIRIISVERSSSASVKEAKSRASEILRSLNRIEEAQKIVQSDMLAK